jgi:hypothetical protein
MGRSWEKAYAIVSRPHEETKRENLELAQLLTRDSLGFSNGRVTQNFQKEKMRSNNSNEGN